MKVSESKLTELLVSMGVDTAPDWAKTPGKLAQRVNEKGGIARYLGDQLIKDTAQGMLYDQIVAAQADGVAVEIEADIPVPVKKPVKKPARKVVVKKAAADGKPTTKNGAKKPGPKPGSRKNQLVVSGDKPKRESTYARVRELWDARYGDDAGRPISNKGPGVILTIVAELKAAGKGKNPKGTTKEEILEVLKTKFPDRDPLKMNTTLSNLVPSALWDDRRIRVWRARDAEKGRMRYWIKGDGKEAQPEPKKETPSKKATA